LKNNSELAKNSELFEKEKRIRGELSLAAANVNRSIEAILGKKIHAFRTLHAAFRVKDETERPWKLDVAGSRIIELF